MNISRRQFLGAAPILSLPTENVGLPITGRREFVLYAANVDAYCQKMRYNDHEPDERLMRGIEEFIGEDGITEQAADDFRRIFMAMCGHRAMAGNKLDEENFPTISSAVDKYIASGKMNES